MLAPSSPQANVDVRGDTLPPPYAAIGSQVLRCRPVASGQATSGLQATQAQQPTRGLYSDTRLP